MMHQRTKRLGLRQREIGTQFPRRLTNRWAEEINMELAIIDEAIGAFCSPEQIEGIKRALATTREGVFL